MILRPTHFDELELQWGLGYKTLIVDAFLVDETCTKILIQRRSAHRRLFPLFWDAIGGHVDAGEKPLAALTREIKEETQLNLTEILALVHQFTWPEDASVLNLQFLCRAQGTLQPESEKISEVRWLGENEIDGLGEYLSSQMRDGLKNAFAYLQTIKNVK